MRFVGVCRDIVRANIGAFAKTRSMLGSNVSARSRAMLDIQATLGSDTRKGGRVNGKETMARRRYQEGCLFTRGTAGRKVWVARWREDVLRPDGTIGRTMRSHVLGPVRRIPTRREARNLLTSLLRPTVLSRRFRTTQDTFQRACYPHQRWLVIRPSAAPKARKDKRDELGLPKC